MFAQKKEFVEPEMLSEKEFKSLKGNFLNKGENCLLYDNESFSSHFRKEIMITLWGMIGGGILFFIGVLLDAVFLFTLGSMGILIGLVLGLVGIIQGTASFNNYKNAKTAYFEKMRKAIATSDGYSQFVTSFYNVELSEIDQRHISKETTDVAIIKEWLAPDIKKINNTLDMETVAKVVAINHSYISMRILQKPNSELIHDTRFMFIANKVKTDLLSNPLSLSLEFIDKINTEAYDEKTPPLLYNLRSAHIKDYAEQNKKMMSSFMAKDWSSFAAASQECVAYSFREFADPYVCLNNSMLRIRAPEGLDLIARLRDWNTFGYCCSLVGFDDATSYAKTQLRINNAQSWSDQ